MNSIINFNLNFKFFIACTENKKQINNFIFSNKKVKYFFQC